MKEKIHLLPLAASLRACSENIGINRIMSKADAAKLFPHNCYNHNYKYSYEETTWIFRSVRLPYKPSIETMLPFKRIKRTRKNT